MAKMKVMGGVFQLTSKITKDDYEKVRAYKPEIFTIKEQGEKIFNIFYVGHGAGSVSPYGVVFDEIDDEGYLYIIAVNEEMPKHGTETEKRKVVAGKLGKVLEYLKEIEDRIEKTIPDIEKSIAEIESCIEFV